MENDFNRFLDTGEGPLSLSDSWPGIDSYSVLRGEQDVDYVPPKNGEGKYTSVVKPSKLRKAWVMPTPVRKLPQMPEIGRPESYYASIVRAADREENAFLREAAKVGQYITLALDPALEWADKLKYFRHALQRHCSPPPYPDDAVWLFYRSLADMVRQHCGAEALRIASREDDLFAARLTMGQAREKIEDDAEQFFLCIMSSNVQCPDWFASGDWDQLKLLRDHWI